MQSPPVIIYSDAEWTVLDKSPWLSSGLGGIMCEPGQDPWAAAIHTPQHLVDALVSGKLRLSRLYSWQQQACCTPTEKKLRGKDIIFFNDNQSVCCALVKGCSRSWDIQLLAASWQLLCLHLGCRVWIEWVPSESNPADILSREGASLYATQNGKVDPLLLPPLADVASCRDIRKVFDAI